ISLPQNTGTTARIEESRVPVRTTGSDVGGELHLQGSVHKGPNFGWGHRLLLGSRDAFGVRDALAVEEGPQRDGTGLGSRQHDGNQPRPLDQPLEPRGRANADQVSPRGTSVDHELIRAPTSTLDARELSWDAGPCHLPFVTARLLELPPKSESRRVAAHG